MNALDKARIQSQRVRIRADLVKVAIVKEFNIPVGDNPRCKFPEEKITLKDHPWINYFRIIQKSNDSCMLEIDFNYPRYYSRTNYKLLNKQEHKEKVDSEIKMLFAKFLQEDPEKIRLDYSYMEAGNQFPVKGFYLYHNVIFLFFKALCNYYESEDKSIYYDYSSSIDRTYTTGLKFKIADGLILELYNKTLENNKKNQSKQVGGEIRTELKQTKSVIKRLYGTTNIDDITLELIRNNINFHFADRMLEAVEKQFASNEETILKRLAEIAITPKNIEKFIAINQDWIFDYETFCCILHKEVIKTKSKRMAKYCEKSAKEALKEYEEMSGTSRSNFDNVKKMENFLKELFGISVKIKQSREEKIQFFNTKKCKKSCTFLDEKN